MGFISRLRSRRRPAPVRTPTLLQMEATECGAAALGIILGYYGRIVPLAELRQACGVSRDGSSATNIVLAARRYSLVANGFKKELDTVQELPCPSIVFWNFNHFVVLEGWRQGRVYLNDPATGRRSVTLDAFDASFTGVVLVMKPGLGFTPGGRPPSLVLALRDRLRHSGQALTYCLLAGLLLVFPSLLTPIFTQLFVDHILIQGLHDWLRPLLLGMLLAALLRGLLLRLQLRQLRRLQLKLATVMSSQFLWDVLHLPASFFAQRFAGEISQRTALNDKVAEALSGRLVTTSIDLFTLLFYAVFMAYYDAALTAIGLGSAAVNLLALQWMARRRVDANTRMLHEFGRLGGVSIAGLQNIETLKASALESEFFARWAGHYASTATTQQELGVANQTLAVLPTLLSALTATLVLVVGGLRVMQGHLSLGMLVAFQSVMQQFLSPVSTLVRMGSTLQELHGDVHRLDDVLRHPAESESSPNGVHATVTIDTVRLQGHVEVRNVTVGYSPVAPPLIDNLSFSLQPGQRIALVGASGSGKSTVAKLVCGLYKPWAGKINLDHIPRAHIPPGVLSQSIAFVDQEIVLFAGTVRDNSPGLFLAFHAALGLFIGGVTRLSQTLLEVLEVTVLWDRTQPIVTQVPEVYVGKRDPGRLAGKIALEHVTFHYHDRGPVVVDDLSLSAAPGESIALVGPSGSGKSTIFRLLLGFEAPHTGAVFYDDQDLAHLNVAAVRRQFGTVLQPTRIMAASIFDNIAGGVAITLEEAWDAARAAALEADIAAMPMQMHTMVSEGGGNLSGGQRQRLLIARALVFKPKIVLFDEATSALDHRTQAVVTASLERLAATRVVIAHRLSTVRHADRIYVLNRGRIVQQGRYEELAQQDGMFAQLMAPQMLRLEGD